MIMNRTHSYVPLVLASIALVTLTAPGGLGSRMTTMKQEGIFDAKAYGARGDGVADDTKAMQIALNEAAKKGGQVYLPPGKYLVSGSLTIPVGVTLSGAAESPQYIEPLIGSVVLATAGEGKEDAPALFELGSSSSVRGLTVFYPNQQVRSIEPYPWTFHLEGGDNTIENVTLINSYNGIKIGPKVNVRHRIRSVYGCVLRRGILVDNCTDIGRIDNVQFHCHWWSSKQVNGESAPVFEYMWKNLEAFVFARTDWEYVNNTFVFPANIGYRFISSENGAMNGQLSGIGADAAQTAVQVDEIQPMGLLITNGQFVAFSGDDPNQVVINPTCTGSTRFVNCSFWGLSSHNVVSHSQGYVSFSDCFFSNWRKTDNPLPLIVVDNGKIQIRGCSFTTPEPSIHLKPGVKHAIITENNGDNGVRIKNEIGDAAIISNNESSN